ncbi:MAG: MGMT family protein [Candidatus Diapherotrites archaeon]|nr:MGMT family protein [Candidatus Diapherotrites archaeon]
MSLRERLNCYLLKIPKGKITTYKELAEVLQTSPRAVATLLRTNKYPDKYPCYKVIMSDGRLGGYSKGAREKKRRLREEGIVIKGDKVQDLDRVLYHFKRTK